MLLRFQMKKQQQRKMQNLKTNKQPLKRALPLQTDEDGHSPAISCLLAWTDFLAVPLLEMCCVCFVHAGCSFEQARSI
ncbi:hypothetical protein BIW11_02873 [Tropilaelaps mercedesae]|uniref:Uncharacterized protein n=1 Tax=Tropilaelaps mercedesae TaxID=418985 RepID=A0A1V9XVZ6_9ACAR|nr:hypothetical protein BIW11_02873 [Tropilaelaps mercedesae]